MNKTDINELIENINLGIKAIEKHLENFTDDEKEDYFYMVNNIEVLIRIATMNKYQELKEKARQEAIDYQASWVENTYSYGEIAEYTDYFYKLGKRYGLLKEFRENGIC